MKNTKSLFFSLLTIAVIVSCARVGTVPGGPKDEDPPIPVKAKPENYATNYTGKKIVITFDEFIKLNDIYSQFTVSPPLEETPTPILNGKKVVIPLPASELDSFTYTLDFADAIADNNENNPLPDFQFVVSMLPYVDSFAISGRLVDAFNHKPVEDGLFVYLNKNLADTTPITVRPTYLGKTDDEGYFRIRHVAPGTYKVYALKDANNNMLYDFPNEVFAFLDEPITLHPDSFPAPIEYVDTVLSDSALFAATDTLPETDTIVSEEEGAHSGVEFTTHEGSIKMSEEDLAKQEAAKDSTLRDSLEFTTYGFSVNLYSFVKKEPFTQYIEDFSRPSPEQLNIIFGSDVDSMSPIKLIRPDTVGLWYLLEHSRSFDTLTFWLPDSNMISNDSIILSIDYQRPDSLGNLFTYTDTLLFNNKIKKETAEKDKKGLGLKLPFGGQDEEEADTLPPPVPRTEFKHNIKNKTHDLYLPIIITQSYPVFEYDPSKFEFFRIEDDTVEVANPFTLRYDSSNFRKTVIKVDFESETKYILRMHEGAFTDIYGRTIDSTEYRFTTQSEDFYGTIDLSLTGIQGPTIVQLLEPKKEEVLKEYKIYSNRSIEFDFLNPGTYLIKLIFDDNDNGIWDTGEYEKFIQPETVKYYYEEIELKSGAISEIEWKADENIIIEEEHEHTDNEDGEKPEPGSEQPNPRN